MTGNETVREGGGKAGWAEGPIAKIVSTASLNFVCYLCIGLQLATVPVFVHLTLKFGAALAGLAVSVQYVATLASRPLSGLMADRIGSKKTTCRGLMAVAVSGVILAASGFLTAWPVAALITLMIGRLVLGFGESWVATGCTIWGIGRVQSSFVPQVIAWTGMACYGALAVGAPAGVWAVTNWGFLAIGLLSTFLAIGAFAWAMGIPDVATIHGESAPLHDVLKAVLPFGIILTLGGIGFGTVASFVTLYYAHYGWTNPGLLLSMFSGAFVVSRLLLVNTITRFGGHRVAMVSLVVECTGLVALVLATTPTMAVVGATAAGFGFALVFPALGVEAVATLSPRNRGTALGVYTAFIDLSLGIAGPIAGFLVDGFGYPSIFWFAAGCSVMGLVICVFAHRRQTSALRPEAVAETAPPL